MKVRFFPGHPVVRRRTFVTRKTNKHVNFRSVVFRFSSADRQTYSTDAAKNNASFDSIVAIDIYYPDTVLPIHIAWHDEATAKSTTKYGRR